MTFIERVKAGVKAGAEQAATKAREEMQELQKKRELNQAYSDLGRKAFELAERGDLSHGELQGLVERVRGLETGSGSPSPTAAPAQGPVQPTESSEQPPST
jgi:hypothetical protein